MESHSARRQYHSPQTRAFVLVVIVASAGAGAACASLWGFDDLSAASQTPDGAEPEGTTGPSQPDAAPTEAASPVAASNDGGAGDTGWGNDSGCGHDCLGGACVNGACQPVLLAQGQDYPYGLAVNSTSVYWTTSGSVMAMTLDGGTLTTLASGQNYPVGLAIDPANAYWTNNGGDSVGTAPLSGGSFRILAGSQPKLARRGSRSARQ